MALLPRCWTFAFSGILAPHGSDNRAGLLAASAINTNPVAAACEFCHYLDLIENDDISPPATGYMSEGRRLT